MNIKVLGNRVLVEVEKKEEKTAGGFVLARTTEQGEITVGTIKYVGTGKTNDNGNLISPEVKVDDKVMFQYGTLVLLDGKSYLLVNIDDIIIVI